MADSKELFEINAKTNNLTFSAFHQRLVFGVKKNEKFEDGLCFEFNLSEICELFCALFYIVKALTKPNEVSRGILCALTPVELLQV